MPTTSMLRAIISMRSAKLSYVMPVEVASGVNQHKSPVPRTWCRQSSGKKLGRTSTERTPPLPSSNRVLSLASSLAVLQATVPKKP
jgi:hypothetical protein